jgi:hypothetical protein
MIVLKINKILLVEKLPSHSNLINPKNSVKSSIYIERNALGNFHATTNR